MTGSGSRQTSVSAGPAWKSGDFRYDGTRLFRWDKAVGPGAIPMSTLMYQHRGESRAVWDATCDMAARALGLGVAAAFAAGPLGAICGLTLGLMEGNPWTCLTAWGLRAAF